METDAFKELDPSVRNRTKMMLMYFILFSITMLFAGLISAYIVSSLGQYWVHVAPTPSFWISNLLIIASSGTLFFSLKSLNKGQTQQSKYLLALTLILGIGFAITQFAGWKSISELGGGWDTHRTEEGLQAYSWNRIEDLINGTAVYGVDYDVRIDNTPLLYNSETKELFAPNDPLMIRPITNEVKRITNSSGSFLWSLVMVHLLHLTFGLIYLIINLIRISKGLITPTNSVRLKALGAYWHFLGVLWLVLFFFLFTLQL